MRNSFTIFHQLLSVCVVERGTKREKMHPSTSFLNFTQILRWFSSILGSNCQMKCQTQKFVYIRMKWSRTRFSDRLCETQTLLSSSLIKPTFKSISIQKKMKNSLFVTFLSSILPYSILTLDQWCCRCVLPVYQTQTQIEGWLYRKNFCLELTWASKGKKKSNLSEIKR